MEHFETACALLPPAFRQAVEGFGKAGVEEIRLRNGRSLSLVVHGREVDLKGDKLAERDLLLVLERATGASLHSATPSMINGFISYKGIRIGLCGTAAINRGELTGFRNFSSLAIRIPRECKGICAGFIDKINYGGFKNTLIISPPGFGKTTLLRDIIRQLSENGLRVAVLDERNELSASEMGLPQFDLGPCSDVLIGLPKAAGASMLLRGMNPQVIAMDEISREEDKQVIEQVIGCGVSIIASAHGLDRTDMLSRPMYRALMDMGAFKYLLTIYRDGSRRRYVLEELE